MSAARQVRIIYELRASDAPADGPDARHTNRTETVPGHGAARGAAAAGTAAAGEAATASRAAGEGAAPETAAAWWERTTTDLRKGLSTLGFGVRSDLAPCPARLQVTGGSARFVAEIAAGVVSEAVRLTMSWIGRSPHREATLTSPCGEVLRLAGQPQKDELNLITQWLVTTTGTGRRPAPGPGPGPGPGPTAEPGCERGTAEEPGPDGRSRA